ncbi:MAG TPA: UbiA family prenyltransferase, partial [Anaerolineales bacterium]|nr:UbiA family prenyltransferase [Anaerolineales bacterium]
MTEAITPMQPHIPLGQRLRFYWALTKWLQSSLLLLTGLAGYLSSRVPFRPTDFAQMLPSLFLAICGSTILNMWWDRDIDARMKRTHRRPAPAGMLPSREVLILGTLASVLGIGWAFGLGASYGNVVFAGWFFDVVVYSIWLKRRTCWSIVWGGVAGAMPVLAGRVLATG